MQKLVTLAKTLSDINRVKILSLLKREHELCVCEICDTLELSQPLVSRHLKQMREALLIESKKEGKWIIYKLSLDENLHYLLDTIKENIQILPRLIKCLK
jgi:ArsR family transcriptional regulator